MCPDVLECAIGNTLVGNQTEELSARRAQAAEGDRTFDWLIPIDVSVKRSISIVWHRESYGSRAGGKFDGCPGSHRCKLAEM